MNSTPEDTQTIINGLKKESKAIMREIYQLCWYMRGGVTREEAWNLCFEERQVIHDIVKKNVEATEKTGLALL